MKEKVKNKNIKNTNANVQNDQIARFKIVKSKIREMYESDRSIRRNVNQDTSSSVTYNTVTLDNIAGSYYSLTTDLDYQRDLSYQIYTFSPIYANVIDYLSNMFLWRYVYIPRKIKDKGETDYNEVYNLMGEIVDGITIESTFPAILTDLLTNGAVFLISTKDTSSKSISTISLPYKYCRINAVTQYGTYTFQFDFSYFDNLGLNTEELNIIFDFFPKEIREKYNIYLNDRNNLRWQQLDPKFACAVALNKNGFPTKLNTIFSIKRYDLYQDNELTRNSQLLDKIITHQMPTWEDQLVVSIEEMAELHTSIAKVLQRNSHLRLITSFGKMDLLSIGEDQSKENKVLEDAFNAIYSNLGENHSLFNGDSVQALTNGLKRDISIIWKYVQQLVSYYNIVVNNSFNFQSYQCDLSILPITIYDENDKIAQYKDGATLGVNKLEYIVSTGIKQINLQSKLELEKFLNLEQLKPLSSSYTQKDNSVQEIDTNVDGNEEQNKEEQEVEEDENNTK